MAVGWLDRAAWWWHGLEIDVICVDDRRGGGEIRLGLGLGFALIYQLRFSLFLYFDSLRLGFGLGFGFILIFLLWLLSVFAGS